MKLEKKILSYEDYTEDYITFPQLNDPDAELRAAAKKREQRLKFHTALANCPYCSASLDKVIKDKLVTRDGVCSEWLVLDCPECGWWLFDYYVDDVIYTTAHRQCYAILRRFDVSSIDAPLSALRAHIDKHFTSIRDIHPRKFEDLCQSVFKDFLDCEIRRTGYTRDGGIDLYALNGATQYAIQLKRRGQRSSEGGCCSARVSWRNAGQRRRQRHILHHSRPVLQGCVGRKPLGTCSEFGNRAPAR